MKRNRDERAPRGIALLAGALALVACAPNLDGGRQTLGTLELSFALERASEDKGATLAELRDETVAILGERLDGEEARVEASGESGLRVELPWRGLRSPPKLAAGIGTDTLSAQLSRALPGVDPVQEPGPWLVLVDDELILCNGIEDKDLRRLERGAFGTTARAHDAGTAVQPVDVLETLELLVAEGRLEVLLEMRGADFYDLGAREQEEHEKVRTWLDEHGDTADLAAFHALPSDAGGPAPGVRWLRVRAGDVQPVKAPGTPDERPEWLFTSEDLESVHVDADNLGYPAVGFELRPERKDDFTEMTGEHVHDSMALVLDGKCLTFATIQTPLPGGGIIQGGIDGFTTSEVMRMVRLLRARPLPLRPRLVSLRATAE